MIANNAGNAKFGLIFPLPISTPINVPITCAITAPGPSNTERNGIEQIKPNITSPIPVPAKGINNFANQSPKPEPCIKPMSNDTNPMKGMIDVIIVCTASLAAWLNVLITLPAAIPIFVTIPPLLPSAIVWDTFLSALYLNWRSSFFSSVDAGVDSTVLLSETLPNTVEPGAAALTGSPFASLIWFTPTAET